MAKKPKVEAEIFDEIRLNITQADLDAAMAAHINALEAQIRSGVSHPADNSILTLIQTIKALRTEIITRDDPAGRGIGSSDMEE